MRITIERNNILYSVEFRQDPNMDVIIGNLDRLMRNMYPEKMRGKQINLSRNEDGAVVFNRQGTPIARVYNSRYPQTETPIPGLQSAIYGEGVNLQELEERNNAPSPLRELNSFGVHNNSEHAVSIPEDIADREVEF